MSEPCDLTAVDARRLIGARRLSPVELMESCLARIAAVDPALNAIVAIDEEAARAGAKAAEEAVAAGAPLGPLHGLPLAAKDSRDVEGMTTTEGALIHADRVATRDDPGIARLRAAGAIPFAKTNMPEFGAGANTTNRLYGATGNPFDPSRTCGGSSGGSAVALATAMSPVATGSDYGGSLRTPATFCGIVGFRPSMGLVPMERKALSPWTVQGPMGRTVADAHLSLAAKMAFDPRDPYARADPALAAPPRPADLASLRVAVSADMGAAPVASAIRETFAQRIDGLADDCGLLSEASPDFGPIHEVFEITRGVAFLASHHETVKAHRDALGPNVVDNVDRGLTFDAADVGFAHREQAALYQRVVAFFAEHDVLITPAAAVSPFPHSSPHVREIDGAPMDTYMRWLALAYMPTLALCCAAVVPCGRDGEGMPFGLQIVGPQGADAKVLAVAAALETRFETQQQTARPLPDLAALTASAGSRKGAQG